MVNNIEELKNLIIWAKEQKVKSFKIADIHIELSDLALVESLTSQVIDSNVELTDRIKSTEDAQTTEEQNEDLFWSTR
jgi:CO dehydrogenase/acetyl-CoA synthase delta subunit